MTARGNQVYANIILAPVPVSFEDQGNTADYNVFGDAGFDLEAWQASGQDLHGRKTEVRGVYDPATAEMAFSTGGALPSVPRLLASDVDYFGPIAGATPSPSRPFSDRFAGEVVLDLSPLPRQP